MGTEVSSALRAGPLGYGMGPVAVAGGITLMCAVGLLFGGYGVVANALSPAASPPGIHAAPGTGADDEADEDEADTSTPTPTPTPERESAPEEEAPPTDTVYLIQWGDTLTQISRDTGVSVERLAEYNSIPNVDLIYADALLNIPYILIPGPESTTEAPE
jgi:LysM repeat protein